MTYCHSDGSYTALSFIEGEGDTMFMVDYRADGTRIHWDTNEEIPANIRSMTMMEARFAPDPPFPPLEITE